MLRFAGTAIVAVAFAISSCNCGEELAPIIDHGAIRGVICADSDGQPAAGMTVILTDSENNVVTATTDATGVFVTEGLVVGETQLVISDAGGDRTGTIVIIKDVITPFNDGSCHGLPPPPLGTVEGCVCDNAVGQWVEGGNVFVTLPSGDIAATVSDVDGCFSLSGLPTGTFQLTVQKGVFSESRAVDVIAGSTTSLPAVECTPPVVPDNAGSVSGRVCAPDGETWLSGADVYVELENGTRVAVVTDADGRYALINVPVGRHTLHVEKGSFSSSSQVDVFADSDTEIPEGECSIAPVGLRIALVTGDYDDVGQVLNTIGIDNEHIEVFESSTANNNIQWVDDLLLNYERLQTFDIVFLNCGAGDRRFTGRPAIFGFPAIPVSTQAIANLRQFVAEGGSVYASDWAYTFVEATWPDFVDFAGNESVDAAKVGFAPFDVTSSITDAAMSSSLGQTSMELHYPLAQWAVMESVSAETTVYVRANAKLDTGVTLQNVPHTIAFRPGAGRVLFTSFHQEAGINPDMQRILQLLMFEL